MENNKELKLGIVGVGFVGKSVQAAFDTFSVRQFIVDPKLNNNTIKDLAAFNPDITFICVPTPQNNNNTVDASITESVLDQLEDAKCSGTIVIKSTITPNHLIKFNKKYHFPLVYNPEFLREATAIEDFLNPAMQVLGGKWDDCIRVEKAYKDHSKVKTTANIKVDIVTASMIKYTINSWLATKVVFMNEIYKLHKVSGAATTWDAFTDILQRDPRVGSSHLQVPGPDSYMGFGGHCFPKDTAALVEYAKKLGTPQTLLQSAREINDNLRNENKLKVVGEQHEQTNSRTY